jgi:hypothetical protein
MPFSQVPTTWVSGWSEDGTNITVPIASFPEMTAAEADGATGDIRKIYYAICDQMFAAYNNTAAADRPTRMNIVKTMAANTTTGITIVTYRAVFYCATASVEVIAE